MLRTSIFASTICLLFSGSPTVGSKVAESFPVFQPVNDVMVMSPCSWVVTLNIDRDRIPGTERLLKKIRNDTAKKYIR